MPSVAPIYQSPLSRSQKFSLAAVFSASFGVGLIFGFQPPLLALVLARGGASSFEIGAVTSISTVAVMLCGPLYPGAIARLGLRRATILGIAVSTAVLFVMPWLPGVQGWLVLRFVTGCALGLEWIASEIWLNRLSTDQSRGTVMGAYATVFAAGVIFSVNQIFTAGGDPCTSLPTLGSAWSRNACAHVP
jgi:MFS family permease